jgi:hypothetical protein
MVKPQHFANLMVHCKFLPLSLEYSKLLIICVQIIQFAYYPCMTFFYMNADMCELGFQ